MVCRVFEDEQGNIWIVTKTGSNIKVQGKRLSSDSLYKIARSCAYRLGVRETNTGIPLKYINQHRRIWNIIWNRGRSA